MVTYAELHEESKDNRNPFWVKTCSVMAEFGVIYIEVEARKLYVTVDYSLTWINIKGSCSIDSWWAGRHLARSTFKNNINGNVIQAWNTLEVKTMFWLELLYAGRATCNWRKTVVQCGGSPWDMRIQRFMGRAFCQPWRTRIQTLLSNLQSFLNCEQLDDNILIHIRYTVSTCWFHVVARSDSMSVTLSPMCVPFVFQEQRIRDNLKSFMGLF